ncbi:MAG: SET domain-containing protein-lysine N-methyltransferase [Gammaproteobacteria bacterium]|nr:SET domain-containing protein-lysine N-methyltransferase [Gammaproteobacteria bacterium]
MPRRIQVRRSSIHGRGVFAVAPIAAGTDLIDYRGRLITHAEADRRYGDDDSGHTFLFSLNRHYVIDAGHHGNSARFINHSCEPNCETVLVESDDGDPKRDRVVIQTLRDIVPGEELAYDYRIDAGGRITRALLQCWACHCGAPRCRGTLLYRRRPSRR